MRYVISKSDSKTSAILSAIKAHNKQLEDRGISKINLFSTIRVDDLDNTYSISVTPTFLDVIGWFDFATHESYNLDTETLAWVLKQEPRCSICGKLHSSRRKMMIVRASDQLMLLGINCYDLAQHDVIIRLLSNKSICEDEDEYQNSVQDRSYSTQTYELDLVWNFVSNCRKLISQSKESYQYFPPSSFVSRSILTKLDEYFLENTKDNVSLNTQDFVQYINTQSWISESSKLVLYHSIDTRRVHRDALPIVVAALNSYYVKLELNNINTAYDLDTSNKRFTKTFKLVMWQVFHGVYDTFRIVLKDEENHLFVWYSSKPQDFSKNIGSVYNNTVTLTGSYVGVHCKVLDCEAYKITRCKELR